MRLTTSDDRGPVAGISSRGASGQMSPQTDSTLSRTSKTGQLALGHGSHPLADRLSNKVTIANSNIGGDVYKRLVQSITDYAIYMLDLDGRVVTWNAGAYRTKGYTAEEIVGRHFACFYAEADRVQGAPMANLSVARREGKYESEGWRVRKDGSLFWAHVVIDALHDARGNLFGFAKITRDCTSQRKLGQQADETAQHFRRFVQGVTDYAIYMLDANGIVTNWNIGAERAKGYQPADIIGKHFSCFYTEEDQLQGVPARGLATALAQGKFRTEGWRVRKDGSQFWANVVIDAILDDKGKLLGYAKVTRDCSDARKLLAESQQQEQRFRALVEGVTDYAIYLLDPNGIVSNWNAGAERAKQYQASEIVGQYFGCFYSEQDQLAGLPAFGLQTARTMGKYNAEGWRIRKDGTRFWANVVIQPVYDDTGHLFGFAKITRDCTEQRETATALAATTQNLDLALDNMLQGLCLFDRRGKVVLSNRRFNDIIGLRDDAFYSGMRLSVFLRTICDAQHEIRPSAVEFVAQSPEYRLTTSAPASPVETADFLSPSHVLRRALPLAVATTGQHAAAEFVYQKRHLAVSTRWLPHGEWLCTVEDVTEQRAVAKRIHHLAHHDALTGLPNRTVFQDRLRDALTRASGRRSGFALFYMDLDGFKIVNDTLGHHVGDALLKAVSARFASLLQDDEHLSRLGGDEFTIISMRCQDLEDAQSLANRCIRALAAPFVLADHEVRVGVSIGVVSQAFAAFDADNVLQQADLALYKSKREGRNQYCLYEPGMNDPLRIRNELEAELRSAMRAEELRLHYQPLIDAKTGHTTACEALLRWPHKHRGNVPPSDFIPIAEERGLMPELGAWVLARACRDAVSWPEGIRLNVNVSPAQLQCGEFVTVLKQALAMSGLNPGRLELEITETTLLENADIPLKIMNEVCAMGISVAMDDFGTGYSSLGLLQSFPFSSVKVDRSFIQGLGQNPKSMAIVRSVTGLCRSLGMAIIAEGVETAAQKAILDNEDCSEYQGFLICRPVAQQSLLQWFADEAQQCRVS